MLYTTNPSVLSLTEKPGELTPKQFAFNYHERTYGASGIYYKATGEWIVGNDKLMSMQELSLGTPTGNYMHLYRSELVLKIEAGELTEVK